MEFLPLVVIFFQIYLIFTVIVLLLDNRQPAGDIRMDIPQFAAKQLIALFKSLDDAQETIIKDMKSRFAVYQDDLMTLLYRNSRALITLDNKVEFFHNGKDKFDRLIEDLKAARKYIHMEYLSGVPMFWGSGSKKS